MPSLQLQRSVLWWVQSLDLAFPVKNARRDFSNGFLVAEMFSRYYPREVALHSYSTNSCVAERKDNWNQLARLFARIGLDTNQDELNNIMHSTEGASVAFIEKCYEFLTKREVKRTEIRKDAIDPPLFASQTASNLIRAHLRRPEMLDMQDIEMIQERNEEVLDSHKSRLAVQRTSAEYSSYIFDKKDKSGDKLGSPKEFSESKISANSPLEQSIATLQSQRSVAPTNSSAPSVEVKEVRVRQVNINPAKLRGGNRGQRTMSVMPGKNSPKFANGDNSEGSAVPLVNLMDKAVWDVFSTGELETEGLLRNLRDSNRPCDSLAYLLEHKTDAVPEELISKAFLALENVFDSADARNSVLQSVQSPKQFWEVFSLFSHVFRKLPEGSLTYKSAQKSICAYGRVGSLMNPEACEVMFFKTIFPRIRSTLEQNAGKRQSLLQILYSFVPTNSSAHIRIVKRLHSEMVNKLDLFIQCLTFLIYLETDLNNEVDGDALVDLYLYYAVIGSEMASPNTRTASVAMLCVLSATHPDPVIRLIPKVKEMAADPWWELRSTVVILCSKLLEVTLPGCLSETRNSEGKETSASETKDGDLGDEEEIRDQLVDLCLSLFSTNSPENLTLIGLVYLAPVINMQTPPRLVERFVQILLAQTKDSWMDDFQVFPLLDISTGVYKLPLTPTSGISYFLEPLCNSWDGLVVANEIMTQVQSQDNLEKWHALALESALCNEDFFTGPVWDAFFPLAENHLCISLCDPEVCEIVAKIFLHFATVSPLGSSVFELPTFIQCVKLLFTGKEGGLDENANLFCQKSFADVFSGLLLETPSSPVANAVADFVLKFSSTYPELLHKSAYLASLEANAGQMIPDNP